MRTALTKKQTVIEGCAGGSLISLADADTPGILVKPEVAHKQLEAERSQIPSGGSQGGSIQEGGGSTILISGQVIPGDPETPTPTPQAKRFHGTVTLDTTRVGRDASRIAEEVIAHLSGMVGATVTVTLEVETHIPSGAPDQVVRTVTENCNTLRFTNYGFEEE